ncbi:hypothetical protein ACJJTC_003398 [Scirpophaga incertulas]
MNMLKPKKRNKVLASLHSVRNQIGYFGDKSSLHGVRYVISTSPVSVLKRIFWLLVLSVSGVCAAAVLLPILNLYSEDQVTFLVETDYLHFDTPFPAVTLCELSNVTAVKAYINQ